MDVGVSVKEEDTMKKGRGPKKVNSRNKVDGVKKVIQKWFPSLLIRNIMCECPQVNWVIGRGQTRLSRLVYLH